MSVGGLERDSGSQTGGLLLSAARPRPARARKGAGGPSRRTPVPGQVPVAFLIERGIALSDFAGPLDIFASAPEAGAAGFFNYTVAADRTACVAHGGVEIVPDYGLDDAPMPKVLVIPGQGAWSARKIDWIRAVHAQADMVLAVGAGAFLLAEAGLLDGLKAGTHHSIEERFAKSYPQVELVRSDGFVECGKVVTAAGFGHALDAALHIFGKYFGAASAADVAEFFDHRSIGA